MSGAINCYTEPVPRRNEVNKFDYSDELADYHSSSLWTVRGLMANQEWWTVEELRLALREKGFKLEAMSVSAHIRTLRKPEPLGGQYPCHRRAREKAKENDPREYEYLLGEWGTGMLNDEQECEQCAVKDKEISRLRGFIDRYHNLVERYRNGDMAD